MAKLHLWVGVEMDRVADGVGTPLLCVHTNAWCTTAFRTGLSRSL